MRPLGTKWASEAAAAGLVGHQAGKDGLIEAHDTQNRLVRIWADDAGAVQESRTSDTGFHPQLTEEQIAAIKTCLAAHNPRTEEFHGEPVFDAASVNAVTVKRIASVAGDVNAQLKALRLSVWAMYVKDNPGGFSLEERNKAASIIADSLSMHAQVEAIRLEGAAFKSEKKLT